MRLPQGVPGAMRVMRSFSWALIMVVSPATAPNISAETAEAQPTGPGWWQGGLTRTPSSDPAPKDVGYGWHPDQGAAPVCKWLYSSLSRVGRQPYLLCAINGREQRQQSACTEALQIRRSPRGAVNEGGHQRSCGVSRGRVR